MEKTAMMKVRDLIYEMYQSDELSDDQFAKLRVAVEYDGIPKEREQYKTAMQDVYDKFNSSNVTIKELFNWLADNETRLLAKERKQIVEAHLAGDILEILYDAEQYYSSKYEQK